MGFCFVKTGWIDSLIIPWRPMLLLYDSLWVWDSLCIIGFGLNSECARGYKGHWWPRFLINGTRLLYIYIHIMGMISTSLDYLLMTHCSIDMTSRIGDREGVRFPILDVYHVCMLLQLILFGNMTSRGTNINVFIVVSIYICVLNSGCLICKFNIRDTL